MQVKTMTLFRRLVQERGWTTIQTFGAHFAEAACELAAESGERRLAHVSVSRRTFDRWMAGDLKSVPQRDTRRVLEHLFQQPTAYLFTSLVAPAATLATTSIAEPPSAFPSALGPAHRAPYGSFDDPLEVVTQTQALMRSNADVALLDHLRLQLQSIVDRSEALGPQELVGEARLLRSTLHTLLGGQNLPWVRSELFVLAGRAAGLLARLAVNAAVEPTVAEAYCAEAEDLAGISGTGNCRCGRLAFDR